MPFYDENGNIVANGEHTRGDGAGILTFSTLSELQAALPNGSHSPVWVSSEKTWYHWNPSSVADTTAPNNITGLAVSNFAYNALTLSWTASNSLDVAGYRVYNGSTLIGSPTSSPFNVTGLNPQTAYTFFVKAIDSSNNLSSGVNVDATTPATPADTTPPANVASVSTSNLAETSVTLTWTASSSGDVSGYDIYNGSTFITTVTVLTYNVTGLTASTQYTFWVKARDAAGNVATGTSTTATTAAVAVTAITSDGFTGTDGTTVGGRATDIYNGGTAKTWTTQNGSSWAISGNKLSITSTTTADAIITLDSGVSDCTVQGTFSTNGATADDNPRLYFRFTDMTNHFLVQATDTNYQLFRKMPSYTLKQSSTGITPANGDIVKVVLLGSSIQVYINGTLAITDTDTNLTTATKHGFGANGDTAHMAAFRFDDFNVTTS